MKKDTSKLTIQMVDLQRQYQRLKPEIDEAMRSVISDAHFIEGQDVKNFASELGEYLSDTHVVPCANGTDALQIAMMSLDIPRGGEIIIPSFNYVAAAEATILTGLIPVFVDVDPKTFNINPEKIEEAITPSTRAIVAVHLFGQCADMESILAIAKKHNLYVIEDNAQSVGALYRFSIGKEKFAGTIGDIATTSFFPSKPLACYGDGGALLTDSITLAEKARQIAHHGQTSKYHHEHIGMNSRLDTIQAAILRVKLNHLDEFTKVRKNVAARYDSELSGYDDWTIPYKSANSTHIYHQYTLQISDNRRDNLQDWLRSHDIPSMIYYPLPIHQQEAYRKIGHIVSEPIVAEELCKSVLSLPIHTEMTEDEQSYIIKTLKEWTKK